MSTSTKTIFRPLLAATLALALGVGVACSKTSPQTPEPERAESSAPRAVELDARQMKAAGIEVVTVVRALPLRDVELTGAAAYDETRTARISSRISGRVIELLKDFGSAVRRGDVVCVLDSPELGEAQSEYLTRLAEYRVVKQSADRARRLVEKKAISQGEFLEREGALRRAEAALAFAENRLHLFDMGEKDIRRLGESLRDDTSLHGIVSPELAVRSPMAGTVTRLEVSRGEVVDRLQTLVVVSDLTHLWAWLDVYEKDLAGIRKGQKVTIVAEAIPTETFEGKIDFIGEVEPQTRAARVRVRLTNPNERLLPGMFVRATVAVPATQKALIIPREAVQDVEGRSVVFRETGPGRFEPVPVTVSRTFDGQLEIAEGLQEGDRVAARGAFTLKGELLKDELGEEE
ncbi:MAG TPA: efflux RND transporter periplasmic adaptor subunit [Acidobacteria bacterium]|nr:efflux RND transporter periplasmic adaptor subunit [Acidobacteriota bacterium]